MGKGDRKTKRGKITKGTYGVSRLRKKNKKRGNATATVKSVPKKAVKRSARKKTVVKEVAEKVKKQVEVVEETTKEVTVEEDKPGKETVVKDKSVQEKAVKDEPENGKTEEKTEKDKAEQKSK